MPPSDRYVLSTAKSGNPLIDAIQPFPVSLKELYQAVAALPGTLDPERRCADKLKRILDLTVLDEVYVPTTRDLRSAMSVLRMIVAGYKKRAPSATYWSEHKSVCESLKHSPIQRPEGSASAPSMAIEGVSGSGKSTSIENLLRSIHQTCEHDQSKNRLLPRNQVVWVKVTCPVNRSPRAFIRQFFTEIDILLNTSYSKAYNRQNDDESIVSMGNVARTHFLGLLVIDEIQNVVSKSMSSDRRLLKLFVNIAGSLRVPIIFVGTPKSQEALNAELADARRMLGPKWLPFRADDPDWKIIIDTIWQCQFTRTETILDDSLRAKIFDLTQGIPALAKSLYSLTQERIIINSTKEDAEKITPELLDLTFAEDMQSVAGAVQALRTNSGFDVYDDLLPKDVFKSPLRGTEDNRMETVARNKYEDVLIRAAGKAAKERAAELFTVSGT